MAISSDGALIFVNKLLKQKNIEDLNNNQARILSELWTNNNLKYPALKDKMECSLNTVKTEGSHLWQLLTEATGEKINKGNFKNKLTHYIQSNNSNINSTVATNTVQTSILTLPSSMKLETKAINDRAKPSQLILESPKSVVPLNSPFYIQRKEELSAYPYITQPASIIRIKGQRNSGKTSFMARLIAHADTLNYKTIAINFHAVEDENFKTIKSFWKWFCRYLTRELNLTDCLDKYWYDNESPSINSYFYFKQYLLIEESRPILLALDRVDHIRNHLEVSNDFFAAIRSWHERKIENIWSRVHYLIVQGEKEIEMRDTQSPFNVGLPVELLNFSIQEIIALAQAHNLAWTESEVKQLQAVLKDRTGEPQLIRRVLHYLVLNNLDLDRFLELDLNKIESFQFYSPKESS